MAKEHDLVVNSSIRPYMKDNDRDDIYIPGRTGFYGCKENTTVILPDMDGVRAYQNDFVGLVGDLGIRKPDTLYIPGDHYLMDVNIADNLPVLAEELSCSVVYTVHPYAYYPELGEWVSRLNSDGYQVRVNMAEHSRDPRHIQSRGGWARWVDNPDEVSFPEKNKIRYPVSYCGQGIDQVCEAYERVVDKTGNNRVVFKPVFSAGGSTIAYANSIEEVEAIYAQMKADNALLIDGVENPIEIQEHLEIARLYSFQYVGNRLITPGEISGQYTSGKAWMGNNFNGFPGDLRIQARTIFSSFITGANEKYPGESLGKGGMDLAEISGSDQLFVVEHNGGRITGAHIPIDFNRLIGLSGNAFLSMMVKADPMCSLAECALILKQNNLYLDVQNANGVFPLGWFEGCTQFYSTGVNIADAERNFTNAVQVLDKEGVLNFYYE